MLISITQSDIIKKSDMEAVHMIYEGRENLFSSKILERGYDYWAENRGTDCGILEI